jgi:heme A synthase
MYLIIIVLCILILGITLKKQKIIDKLEPEDKVVFDSLNKITRILSMILSVLFPSFLFFYNNRIQKADNKYLIISLGLVLIFLITTILKSIFDLKKQNFPLNFVVQYRWLSFGYLFFVALLYIVFYSYTIA